VTEPEYLSVYQAAEFLRISHTTIYRYIDTSIVACSPPYGLMELQGLFVFPGPHLTR